jgi:predicted Zn-dependent protease
MSTVQELFEEGLKRYEAGEPVASLLPVFKEVAEKQPRSGPALTCLAWLYLLNNQAPLAVKHAKQAAKLAPADAQAHVNLALALLEAKQPGVREIVERARQVLAVSPDQAEEVQKNCRDGLVRRPDWKALQKVQQWLFEE